MALYNNNFNRQDVTRNAMSEVININHLIHVIYILKRKNKTL